MGLTQFRSNVAFRSSIRVSSTGDGVRGTPSGSDGRAYVSERRGLPSQNYADLLTVGLEFLDVLSVALTICDSSSRLLHANQIARNMLHSGDGLRIDSFGRLRTSKPSSPVLSDVIRELAEAKPTPSDPTHGVIAVPRPSGKRPLIVSLLSPAFFVDHTDTLVPAVPIIFWEHEEHRSMTRQFWYGAWDFTPAESRFANLLMQGLSLADCCQQLGICRSTGAFHLKNLFRKTGARRQIELLSILFREIGVRSVVHSGSRGAVIGPSPRVESNVGALPAERSFFAEAYSS
jgi:DNA-binding CsgD family transcriptional regulator